MEFKLIKLINFNLTQNLDCLQSRRQEGRLEPICELLNATCNGTQYSWNMKQQLNGNFGYYHIHVSCKDIFKIKVLLLKQWARK